MKIQVVYSGESIRYIEEKGEGEGEERREREEYEERVPASTLF